MTRLPQHIFTGVLSVMDGDISNKLANDSGCGSPGDIMRVFPNVSTFYAQKVNDDFYTGIGMYGNYGLATDYGSWTVDRLIKGSVWISKVIVR